MDETFKEKALVQLEQVIDPELGVDIVDLGLIYDVALDDAGVCVVTMTLTIMGCPLSDMLSEDIDNTLSALPEVKEVKINLVWEPAWSVDNLSRQAKIMLGIH
ncbi:metal-sulfur cluster assembly factor [Lacticaseibacillus baoqingensis]|uniref:Metal-sulfur cluster assembly factor n=1 Tax=Lacticaseibacillus baoqingensis TaxID=2486013 RepID=A0ABW4E3P2_9LACO|nr:metal-sulfur cluster assembly factor [Lacticaseibacillus baoqingensis]